MIRKKILTCTFHIALSALKRLLEISKFTKSKSKLTEATSKGVIKSPFKVLDIKRQQKTTKRDKWES